MKKGFTIIELVIVISVLIILIGIAIPRMKGMQQSANIVKVNAELQTLQTAIESYYTNSTPNAYPGWNTISTNAIYTNIQATYLVNATPQIITAPLYDPLNPTPSTEYSYVLSPGGQYYVIFSVGLSGNAQLQDTQSPLGSYSYNLGSNTVPICVTNGTTCLSDAGID